MATGKTRFGRSSVFEALQQSEQLLQKEVASADAVKTAKPVLSSAKNNKKDVIPPMPPMQNNTEKKETSPLPPTTAGLSALSILDTNNKYKNSKQQINIDESYRQFISLIADLYDISISQVTNNMLKVVFDNELLIKELKTVASKKYKEKMSTIDLKLSKI
ncbi:hypothetical protein FACS189452_09310 [Bacteroidia bacterium]|nr:hypothetical protein FACS189452_09310 [Bacteroidia bacterium]